MNDDISITIRRGEPEGAKPERVPRSPPTEGDKTRAKMKLRPALKQLKKGKKDPGNDVSGTLGAGVTALGALSGRPKGEAAPERKAPGSRGKNDW